jgi:hypothetical protein
MVGQRRAGDVSAWKWAMVISRLLMVLGVILLLIALSLGGSGSVVLA